MKLPRSVNLAAILLAVGGNAGYAQGVAPAPGSPPAQRLSLASASMSMDEAVKMAEQRYHARVVKAETLKGDGHVVYVLRLLNDAGRVWTVRVDAASGAVM
ncbi:MAG TPA: PepSY domain-containing protein [Steroidobacteraceae bacterium]|jgi:uncharacterized membrane protein YkoI|nr:PepSY domain-containing protein [Steroidobacteraceae bacterium]